MTIPYQKSNHQFVDPSITYNNITSRAECGRLITNIKTRVLTDKTPLWFTATEFCFCVITGFFMTILPSWFYYVNPTFNPWWLWITFYITQTLWLTLLFVVYVHYTFDWKIPYIKHINEIIDRQSDAYKYGYCVGIALVIIAIGILVSIQVGWL